MVISLDLSEYALFRESNFWKLGIAINSGMVKKSEGFTWSSLKILLSELVDGTLSETVLLDKVC